MLTVKRATNTESTRTPEQIYNLIAIKSGSKHKVRLGIEVSGMEHLSEAPPGFTVHRWEGGGWAEETLISKIRGIAVSSVNSMKYYRSMAVYSQSSFQTLKRNGEKTADLYS